MRLKSELVELGYDLSRDVDISLVVVKDNNIIALSKGGRETQNIIISTHAYHSQKYPVPALEWVTCDILDKCRAIAKFYLDHLEHIALDYASVRELKKNAYLVGTDAMLEFSKTILQYINLTNIELAQWMNTMKSIVMKYIQVILLSVGKYEYTKEGLSLLISELYKHEFDTIGENCLWFLMRGKRGIFSEKVIVFLHTKYVEIIENYYESFKIDHITMFKGTLHNPTMLPIELYKEFLESPIHPTPLFTEVWEKTYGDTKLNDVFEIESSSDVDRAKLLKFFSSDVHERFIWENQRSPEWLRLLNYYTCGSHTKIIGLDMQSKYNLIRGSIVEMIICKSFVPEMIGLAGFTKIQIGLIVAGIEEKSNGCAPDLLLVSDDEIIPVELKCLCSGRKNGDYYRGLDLAKRQCSSVKNILTIPVIKRALIILSWFDGDDLHLECVLFNL